MRVLFLNPIGTLGGAEQSLLDLIASLRQTASEVQVGVLALEDGPLMVEAAALGASTAVLPLPGDLAKLGESRNEGEAVGGWMEWLGATRSLAWWLPRFSAQLRAQRPQIVHSNGLKTHLLSALVRPTRVPLVWHVHDFLTARAVTRKLLPLVQRRAGLGVAVSEAVASDTRGLLPRLRIETVLNGIRTALFAPGTAAPLDLDALAGPPPAAPGTLKVGLVGTYASWKGHAVFLEAARRVASKAARFYIVGGPVYSTLGSQVSEAELRTSIQTLNLEGRCGLVPFQSSVAGVYSALDIVVQASTRPEPFGRTIAEAMASRRVVVATAWGGALEQLEDGKSGLLVPPNDAEALARALQTAIDSPDLRMRLAGEALARARRDLDHGRLGPRLVPLYDELTRPLSRREMRSGERRASTREHGRGD